MCKNELDNRFEIKIGPLVDDYKGLTGDDLTEEGLSDMTLTHEGVEKEEKEEKKLIL